MKKNYLSVLFLCIVASFIAQTPTFFNYNNNPGGNAFPFGTTTSRKVQWRILANSLGAVTPGNNITVVYFMTANTGSNTYPLINISLKQGPAQFAGGGFYETGMTLVYSGTNVTKTGTTGGWISFTLQTPFSYNPNLPLFVEVEHNATTGTGPTVCQTSPVGPGSGRQYGNYPNATYTGVDATVVHFGIDVVPATPCTGAPPSNTVVPFSFTTCPGVSNPNLSFAQTYSLGGLNYAWFTSTTSAFGPFSVVPGATLSTAPTPSLNNHAWYTAVVTCTNPGGLSTTLTPTQYYVAGNVVSTVPYDEGFEIIQVNDRLPNCSWSAPNLGTSVTSYTAASGNNRVPRTGNKFASFGIPSTNNIVYTNPITMNPGITYSAGLWYTSDYLGSSNWSSLSILVGPNQSTTGLVNIATISPAVSGNYKLLSGTFQVPTTGNYHIAVMANGTSGTGMYLSWDDLFVNIPCEGAGASNSPTVTLNSSATTVCAGSALNLSATGANTYSWNTGATASSIIENPVTSFTYEVVGTSALTGCSHSVSQAVVVNPVPLISLAASHLTVCSGDELVLSAGGAVSYAWSNSATGANITVKPTATTMYSVVGTNAFGCTGGNAETIYVNPLPNISAVSSNPSSCAQDMITLNANGAASYTWISNGSNIVYQGAAINIFVPVTSVFTVTGMDAKGCVNKATVAQNIETCTGIGQLDAIEGLRVFPNPSSGVFVLELPGKEKAITVTDITGRMIHTDKSGQDQMLIDLKSYSSGVYYIGVETNETFEVIKVIKE